MALVKKSLRRTLSRFSIVAGISALFFSGAPLHHQLDREAASVFHTQHAHADIPHNDCLITCSGGTDGSGSCIGANCTGCMGPDAASDLGGGSGGTGGGDGGGGGGGSDGGAGCSGDGGACSCG